jgi:hypothetical protein
MTGENTNLCSGLHFIFTVHLCIIDYFYQQMHQDKIVTIFFIKRVPQYAFRQLYCYHQGFFSYKFI